MRNPQAFQQIQEIRKTNGNPKELLNKILGNYTPEQLKSFSKYVNNIGISNEDLSKYGINIK